MTHNGTYRIENGGVTHPIADMRWNDSVLRVLNNATAGGEPVATGEFFRNGHATIKSVRPQFLLPVQLNQDTH